MTRKDRIKKKHHKNVFKYVIKGIYVYRLK